MFENWDGFLLIEQLIPYYYNLLNIQTVLHILLTCATGCNSSHLGWLIQNCCGKVLDAFQLIFLRIQSRTLTSSNNVCA